MRQPFGCKGHDPELSIHEGSPLIEGSCVKVIRFTTSSASTVAGQATLHEQGLLPRTCDAGMTCGLLAGCSGVA